MKKVTEEQRSFIKSTAIELVRRSIEEYSCNAVYIAYLIGKEYGFTKPNELRLANYFIEKEIFENTSSRLSFGENRTEFLKENYIEFYTHVAKLIKKYHVDNFSLLYDFDDDEIMKLRIDTLTKYL